MIRPLQVEVTLFTIELGGNNLTQRQYSVEEIMEKRDRCIVSTHPDSPLG